MDPKPFIFLSYALTLGGIGAMLVFSWLRMRRAERAINAEREQR